MKKSKDVKHSKFRKSDFFKTLKKCKKIHFVLLFDILVILLMMIPLFFSGVYLMGYINNNPTMKNVVGQLNQFENMDVTSPENSEIIKSLILPNKEVFLKLVITFLLLFVISLLLMNIIFSIMKGTSWSFVKYGGLKKKFVVSFFKKSFLWLFVWFFIILLLATALGGISGIILLQILMLFYFYLTFFVFYPLLTLDYKIGFKKLFKKTLKCAMNFRKFIVPFLWYICALILFIVILGLFFKINIILGYGVSLLFMFLYFAFQKYYLLTIVEKIKKNCD